MPAPTEWSVQYDAFLRWTKNLENNSQFQQAQGGVHLISFTSTVAMNACPKDQRAKLAEVADHTLAL